MTPDALVPFLLTLEAEGWGWKLSSAPTAQGRLYRGTVWREDSAGKFFNVKATSPDPLTALRQAREDGERRWKNRERHIREAYARARREREVGV